MITGNNIIFGYGTVISTSGYSQVHDSYVMTIYEVEPGTYQVGDKQVEDDNRTPAFALFFKDHHDVVKIGQRIELLKNIPKKERLTQVGDITFDFTHGDSEKSLETVTKWFAELGAFNS